MLQGAGYGAIGGAAFGAIGGYYGNDWTLGRVAMHGLAGGGISELSGNDFLSGALFSGASAALYLGYSKMVGSGPDFSPMDSNAHAGEGCGELKFRNT
jgi:filamentous hemagglutinin